MSDAQRKDAMRILWTFLITFGCQRTEQTTQSEPNQAVKTNKQDTPVSTPVTIQAESRCDLYGADYTWNRVVIDEQRQVLQKQVGTATTSAIQNHLSLPPDAIANLKKQIQNPDFPTAVEKQNALTKRHRSINCTIVIKTLAKNRVVDVFRFSTQRHPDLRPEDKTLLDNVSKELDGFAEQLHAQAVENSPLLLQLPKIENHIGDRITFELHNDTATVQRFLGVSIEQLQKNGRWKTVKDYVQCPCKTECKTKMLSIKPKENMAIVWKDQSDCKITGGGLVISGPVSQWQENAILSLGYSW